ncbi:MAG: hypothetical protein Q9225_007446 [Loekoesia sp. 1 TL-2023]
MVTTTHFAFALFTLVNLSTQTLNSLLQKSYDGSTLFLWLWYLATLDYDAAPQRKPDGTGQDATRAPIDPSFSSPFIGQSLVGVTQWLRNKPKSVDLDGRYFGILDKQAEKSAKIALCRVEDQERKGGVATCVLVKAEQSTLFLAGLDSDLDWD